MDEQTKVISNQAGTTVGETESSEFVSVKPGMNLSESLKLPPRCEEFTNKFENGALCLAVDIGSTTQRCILFNPVNEDQQSRVFSTPTEYAMVQKDISNTIGGSGCTLDNLELKIDCLDPGSETMVKSVHIVKGTLLKKLNLPPRALTADVAKVDAESTYVNILSNIAMSFLAKIVDSESRVPQRTIDVDLTVSLPPDDAIVRERTDLFIDRIKGTYTVDFMRLGVKVTFRLTPKSIFIGSEPLAAAIQQLIELDLDEDDNYIFIDCGGRSSGVVLFVDGNLREGSATAFPTGGTTLLNELANEVAASYKVQRPRPETMERVLATGKFKAGAKSIPVLKEIETAKRSVAERLDLGIAQALAANNVQGADFARVYCSGGTFGVAVDESGKLVSDSIMQMLKELFEDKSPYTEFCREPNRETVAKGLVWVRLRYFDM